jgi:hypothetical protein
VNPVPTPSQLFDLSGRTALVTGASSGIGQRFALVLAAAGARVIAVARRSDRLEALAGEEPRVTPVAADVTDPAGRAAAVAAAGGPIDILVNNAARSGRTLTEDEDANAFAEVLEANLVAAYDLARRVAEQAGERGASIINVGSILGLVSGAPLAGAAYAASKAGLFGLTRELAGQWARRGIRSNALAPGWFRTEMTEQLFADERSSNWVRRNTMLQRAGDVSELDGALLFLASSASSYCTGQIIVVDGGWTAR